MMERPPVFSTPESGRFPWYVRAFFWNQKRRYGKVLAPSLLWGRSPRVFVALALLYGALDRRSSPVDPALRTLVTVRVSQINACSFCVDINSATALKRGLSEEKLADVAFYDTSRHFDQRERSVLAYAEAVTYSDRQPEPRHFDTLRHWFDEDGIVELTALIAFQNLSSKFNSALGVPPQGFCPAPPPDSDGSRRHDTG